MDTILEFLHPFVSFIVNSVLIILVFMFVVKPLLNYFIVNREIEHRKKLAREYIEAKREAESVRAEKISTHMMNNQETSGKAVNNPGETAVKIPDADQSM